MNEMVLYPIIRDGQNLGSDMLESIYVASNMASLLDSCKLISGKMQRISRHEIIMNLSLKARPLYNIKVNT